MWVLLVLYRGLRTAITDAITLANGVDSDRASFQLAVTTAQNLAIGAENVVAADVNLAGDIGQAVLASLNPPQRPRVSDGRVKSLLSRRNKHPPAGPHQPADHPTHRDCRWPCAQGRETNTPQPVLNPSRRTPSPRHYR